VAAALTSRQIQARGWGRGPGRSARLWRPGSEEQLLELLAGQGPASFAARGHGRSYGDLATAPQLADLRGLDRVLHFDAEAGTLEAGAGLDLADLLSHTLPAGWRPAVLPGTRWVTLGGAVANDVHGKNHVGSGGFCRWVEGLRLALPDGRVLDCDRDRHPVLFGDTCGGLGLGALILRVRLRLVRAESAIEQRTLPETDLEHTLQRLDEAEEEESVAWLDALPGPGLGRALLLLGRPLRDGPPLPPPARPRLGLPCTPPLNLLRPWALRAFNDLIWRRGCARAGRVRRQDLAAFHWPLDGLRGWNRAYGPAGLLQFQCLLPRELLQRRGAAPLRELLDDFARCGGSPLAVLKWLGPGEPGAAPVAFPAEGLTLALDLPRRPDGENMLRRAYSRVADWGGRMYLAKDSLLEPALLRATVPGLEAWRERLRERDPQGRLAHDLARRLELVP
jgi:decaprenylphospho-beta-D-ribofuranose 2-oxidase